MPSSFKTVAVGGTFDKLHKGHKSLLTKAFEAGHQVLIGLSSDRFATEMAKPHITAPYAQRLKELEGFLRKQGLLQRAKIIRIDDPYGVLLSFKEPVEALVVSKETEPTALKINKKRKSLGLSPLEIIAIKMVPSENHATISTTRIRNGEIDREGRIL